MRLEPPEEGTRSLFIEEALELIEQAGGSRGVNLREVSRRVGCAHTNVYNYFDSLEDLLWGAMLQVVEEHRATVDVATWEKREPEASLTAMLDGHVRFALEHPGWYRFIWLEALPGKPPPAVVEAIEHAGGEFVAKLAWFSAPDLAPDQASRMGELFHTWLHGALCKAIAGRAAPVSGEELRSKIIDDARQVLRILIEEVRGGRRKPKR